MADLFMKPSSVSLFCPNAMSYFEGIVHVGLNKESGYLWSSVPSRLSFLLSVSFKLPDSFTGPTTEHATLALVFDSLFSTVPCLRF